MLKPSSPDAHLAMRQVVASSSHDMMYLTKALAKAKRAIRKMNDCLQSINIGDNLSVVSCQ